MNSFCGKVFAALRKESKVLKKMFYDNYGTFDTYHHSVVRVDLSAIFAETKKRGAFTALQFHRTLR